MADWKERHEVADSDDENEDLGQSALRGDLAPAKSTSEPLPGGKLEDKRSKTDALDSGNAGNAGLASSRPFEIHSSSPPPAQAVLDDGSEDELALPAPRVGGTRKLMRAPLSLLFSESSQLPQSEDLPSQPPPDLARHRDQPEDLGTQIENLIESSPLSSLSTTPRGGTPDFVRSEANEPAQATAPQYGSFSIVIPDASPDGFLVNNIQAYAPARSLRRRNAVQLNPYRVEDAIYRQLSRAAGLAPIRLDRQTSALGEDTQEYVPPPAPETRPGRRVERDDGLRSNPAGYSSQGESMQDQGLAAEFNVPLSPTSEQEWPAGRHQKRRKLNSGQHATNERAHTSLELLLSPSSSGNQSDGPDLPTKKSFRYPPGLTPPQLQTPAVSSEFRSRRAIILSDGDLGDTGQLPSSNSNAPTPSYPRAYNGVDSESESEDEVQSARRRIKGVLPASWLRIDQKKKKAPQPKSTPGVPSSPGKPSRLGVARPISRAKTPAAQERTDHPSPFVIADDPSSGEEPGALDNRIPDAMSRLGVGPLAHILDVDSDEMEEDHIDQMLPARTRKSHGPRKHRRIHSHGQGLFRHSNGDNPNYIQSEISVHLDKRKKPRKSTQKAPKVSLVDVFDTSTQPEAPDFIKIALRTSRNRRDKGRHSPNKKVLRMSTREQTAELEDTVNQWKRGAFRPRNYSITRRPTSIRSPLLSLSGNGRSYNFTASTPDGEARPGPRQAKKQHTLEQVFAEQQQEGPRDLSETTNPRLSARPPAKKPRRGQMISRLFTRDEALPAILEAPKRPAPVYREDSSAAHGLGRASLNGNVSPNPLLDRYLQPAPSEVQSVEDLTGSSNPRPKAPPNRRAIARKRVPKQAQPSFNLKGKFDTDDDAEVDVVPTTEATEEVAPQAFFGFKPSDFDYTLDFDIEPLPLWFSFPQTSIIGNGTLKNAMDSERTRDLQTRLPSILVELPASTRHWGPWNEAVISDLHQFSSFISLDDESQDQGNARTVKLVAGLTHIISYFHNALSFLDSIDRRSCIDHCTVFLTKATEYCTSALDTAEQRHTESEKADLLSALSRVLIISHQLHGIAAHPIVDSSLKTRTTKSLLQASELTAKAAFADGISDLVQFQQCVANCSLDSSSPASVAKVESLVILLHVTKRHSDDGMDFWKMITGTLAFQLPHSAHNIPQFEHLWFRVFAILPLLHVAADGKVSREAHDCAVSDNWSYIERLLSPFLQRQTEQSHQHRYNTYCRVMFSRCYVLASTWNWLRCESILRTLYDFFARNSLHNLPLERTKGHPAFLEGPKQSNLIPGTGDTVYEVFLKFLGSAILTMRSIYTEKRMRSIIFRLTPNHSRSLPKDEAVHQDDLEALRNHHSLLSLLYQVSPLACRPRLDLIRDLVRVQDSHRQACHISIRTWTDLTLFHLAGEEATSSLNPLVDWFDDTIEQLIFQHSTARREAEAHRFGLMPDVFDTTIANNQRQVEAVLLDALQSLSKSISAARSTHALELLAATKFEGILTLFDAYVTRINKVVQKALLVLRGFFARVNELCASKESQEYGDWSAFEDLVPATTSESRVRLPESIQKSLHGLLSNSFGASLEADEELMTEVLQTWTSFAQYQIDGDLCNWGDFVDLYGRESWDSFGETSQKTKYTPLFFAMVIDKDQSAYDQHKPSFLRAWIASLVERESQIKFQGKLTSAILNRDGTNPLLENPPFARSGSPAAFNVGRHEIAERRLALLSCLLSNMWKSHQVSDRHDPFEAAAQKQEYSDLLRTLMGTMKENFIALGSGAATQGSYVELVQAIISLMQQYTKDLCPIDRFFTDSVQFPLPVHDPNYVVGRLKGYALRVSEGQVHKQLTTFVMSSIERAVIDGKQAYLIGQLQCSMLDSFGDGRQETNLRHFFARSIVPAYTALALTTPCGWILAAPLMEALAEVHEQILIDIDGANPNSVSAAIESMTCILAAIRASLELLIDHPGHLEMAHVVRMLQLYYGVACSIVLPMDYCLRHQPHRLGQVAQHIEFLRSFAAYAWSHVDGRPDAKAPPDDVVGSDADASGSHEFALAGLRTALSTRWVGNGEGYKMRSSTGSRAVRTDLGSLEQEAVLFAESVVDFYRSLEQLPSFARRGGEVYRTAWDADYVLA